MLTLADLIHPTHRFVVVTGAFRAGKSLFISSLTKQALEMVDITACIANAAPEPFSTLELSDGHVLYVLEWRGPLLIDPLQSMLGSGLLGTIVVTNSSRPDTFAQTRPIVYSLRYFSIPFVIAANAHDRAQGWSLEDLQLVFKLDDQKQLIACNATQPEETAAALLRLTEFLPDSPFVQKLSASLR